jgi:acetone carboxylase gamma subunit
MNASVFVCVHGGKLITGCDCIIKFVQFSSSASGVERVSVKRGHADMASAAPKSKKSDTNARVISEIYSDMG